MKIFRRVCIALITTGALLLFPRHDLAFDKVPFPAAGLSVKMSAAVSVEGDYFLQVSLPKANQEIGLAEDTVPCSLTVSLNLDDKPPIVSEVTSLSRYAEYGFAKIQYYKGGSWHLRPGEYTVEISSRENCLAATSRGASLSMEQQTTGDTEHFLARLLGYWSGIFFLCLGLLGVVVCEFKKV